MCLLQTSTSAKLRAVLLNTPGMIADIFDKNSDGIGAMYASSAGLKVRKVLPKDAADARRFIESLPDDDREMALHWRMRTHGNIDLAQCHPYVVGTGVALMHNGVLKTGNQADPTKSDTWHFIEDYLKGMSVDALHHKGFGDLLGGFIGANRFAIMSADGRLTVINKDQGTEFEGVWYSNEYAWTPSMVIPGRTKRGNYGGLTSSTWSQGMNQWGHRSAWGVMEDPIDDCDMGYDVSEDVYAAMENWDTEELTALLEEFPLDTIQCLLDTYTFGVYENASDDDLNAKTVAIRQELVKADLYALMAGLEDDVHGVVPGMIASTITWYCTAEVKQTQAA